jgi:hypothetical protein
MGSITIFGHFNQLLANNYLQYVIINYFCLNGCSQNRRYLIQYFGGHISKKLILVPDRRVRHRVRIERQGCGRARLPQVESRGEEGEDVEAAIRNLIKILSVFLARAEEHDIFVFRYHFETSIRICRYIHMYMQVLNKN